MDISVRDWMIIIGALLMLAVLLDGYRRMRNNPGRLRVSLKNVPGEGDENETHTRHELPNGGARVIGRAEGESEQDMDPSGEPEDVLMADVQEPPLLTDEPLGGVTADSREAGETLDMLAGMSADKPAQSGAAGTAVDPQVFVLHVSSRDETGFAGEDILQVLLAFEMRFGEMNFFHRHQEAAGRGSILFSVANMMQPGVFNIDNMSDFNTPGLTFFTSLPGAGDMTESFELMVETASGVAENLGGDLLDETRSVATRQTLEHMRQRIRELERRMLTQANRRD